MNGAHWGGSEELWYKTALFASSRGMKVGCAAYDWPEKEEKLRLLEKNGCRVYRLPNRGRKKKSLGDKLSYKLITPIRLRAAIQNLSTNEYDIVVVNQGGFEVISNPWKNIYKRLSHYALLFHNYKSGEDIKLRHKETLRQWVLRSKANLFASSEIANFLNQQLGITVPNSEIVLNPITFSAPSTLTPYPALINDRYVFVMLAALDVHRKAQDNLIRALSSTKWKSRNWELHIYGEGRDRKLLEELISETKNRDKIFLKGHSKNVQTVLTNSHLVLQLSHMDAMPLSVVEAMSMSRPLVVSRIGDMPKWVIDGENGWVAEDASVEQINQALERAWQQKEKWALAGEKSFEVFNKKFPASVELRLLQQLGIKR